MILANIAVTITPAFAESGTLTGKITHVVGTSVYINLGRNNGIERGDPCMIHLPTHDKWVKGKVFMVFPGLATIQPEKQDTHLAAGYRVRIALSGTTVEEDDPSPALDPRAAQKRTIEEISKVGDALINWLVDQLDKKPASSIEFEEVSELPSWTAAELELFLVPDYIEDVPVLDGWGHPYDYRLNRNNLLGSLVMAIRSPGEDGSYESKYSLGTFDARQWDRDIVWVDGYFERWPDGSEGIRTRNSN